MNITKIYKTISINKEYSILSCKKQTCFTDRQIFKEIIQNRLLFYTKALLHKRVNY